jgi:hypothetical protein
MLVKNFKSVVAASFESINNLQHGPVAQLLGIPPLPAHGHDLPDVKDTASDPQNVVAIATLQHTRAKQHPAHTLYNRITAVTFALHTGQNGLPRAAADPPAFPA